MPTFDPCQTALQYDVPQLPERPTFGLMRWYSFKRAKNVLITGGVARILSVVTPSDIAAADDGSGEGGKAFFRGGTKPVTITSAEQTALEAAGLVVT